jgi:hypothetical protein
METTELLDERKLGLSELLALVRDGRIQKMVVTVLDDAGEVHQMEIKSPDFLELG